MFVNRAPGIIGSTTTEKLEGTSTGVNTVPLPFFPPSFPIPHYCSAPVLSTAAPISVFLVPIISKVGGDASRGSHREFAPMQGKQCCIYARSETNNVNQFNLARETK